MTDIPQLGPEVFVDDGDHIGHHSRSPASPLLSPMSAVDPRTTFIHHGLEGPADPRGAGSDASPSATARSPGGPSPSPQLSPHRPTNSAFSFDGADLSGERNSANSSRRGSAVSAENLVEVLDNSAWGDSIRRSFTMRRPSTFSICGRREATQPKSRSVTSCHAQSKLSYEQDTFPKTTVIHLPSSLQMQDSDFKMFEPPECE